jgi:DNA-binding GntR family transcriptional regulator
MPVKKPVSRASAGARAAAPRVRDSGASSVYEVLRSDILNLKIAPGTLLDDSELSQCFSLSRSPVREALIRLSAESPVQTQTNRSRVVTPFEIPK